MRLTKQEMEDQGLDLRRWLNGLQLAVKQGKSPEFRLKGPCQFPTRMRLLRPGVTSQMRSYMGDEEFRITDIYATKDAVTDSIVVGVTMVPVDLTLVREISSASMELIKAIDLFEGVENWFSDAQEIASSRAKVMPKRPVIKESEDRPEWGAW